MPRRTRRRQSARKPRRRPALRVRWSRWLKRLPVRRSWRVFRRSPPTLQLAFAAAFLAAVWWPVNWAYQVARKPSELWFPVSGVLHKTPTETWRAYGRLFERHATEAVSPELLAALAQTEGAGNPVARTYWRWTFTAQPFEIYRPASSAVGMFQMTDGTFAEARRYCIHNHRVVEDGPWHDWRSCWFNGLYTRVVPSHAAELTAAYLDRRVAEIVARHGLHHASLQQRRDLAAVIHLCGAGAGARYARQGFRFGAGERCGDHVAAAYLAKVAAMQNVFAAERRRANR